MTDHRTPRDLDIHALSRLAAEYRLELDRIKKTADAQVKWYPYDTFSAFFILTKMLRAERRQLLCLAGASPVLDIGCADGDLSFFFESLGCSVVALDRVETNYNRMAGFTTLHKMLGSSVVFNGRDLDGGVGLSGKTFGLAFCLGLLYHLKNPFGFLEELARRARYCLLSSRVAQCTPSGTRIADEPLAYLLNASEANNDSTNYWIFSEGGLRRIVGRTGWDICDYSSTGAQRGSTPGDSSRDQRAFLMLRSNLPDPWLGIELESGWHEMENGSWRWTERTFAVRVSLSEPKRTAFRFRFIVPEHLIAIAGTVSLRAKIAGTDLPACEYSSSGEQVYSQPLPEFATASESVVIQFELDRAYGPTDSDRRVLGLQVIFWTYDAPEPRNFCPITLQ